MKSQTATPPFQPARQSTLRRLDWRFLLPTPPHGTFRHLLLSGGSPGLADHILAAKLAEQVSCGLNETRRVDAAILLHDSSVSLEQAAAVLEPGGVLYQEIARSPRSLLRVRPRHLHEQLRQAGLTQMGLYWAAPNFEQCRRYIPLDVPDALQWYFSSIFVAGTPLHLVIETVFRLIIGKASHRLGWFVPSLSITAIASSTDARPPSVLDDPHMRATLPDAKVRPMLLTSGQDDASRVILLPFGAQQRQSPLAVVKIATDPKFNAETEHEQTVLHEVRAQLEPSMRQSVPQPLASFHYQGLAVGVESCAPGYSLWRSSGGWGTSARAKLADLEIGTQWLIRFHQQTQVARLTWDQRAITRWVEEPLAAYALRREVGDTEARLFSAMRAHAHALRGAELPLVWQHHDFAPWNLFRAGDHLTVIDWEFNRSWDETRAGPALCDLLYFLTYWNNLVHQLYRDEEELDGINRLFIDADEDHRYIQAARRAIAEYMAALDIDWRFFPLLLGYLWTERVVYSYRRVHKLQRNVGTSRAADKFAKYVARLATHTEELFAVDNHGFWQEAARQRANVPDATPLTRGTA